MGLAEERRERGGDDGADPEWEKSGVGTHDDDTLFDRVVERAMLMSIHTAASIVPTADTTDGSADSHADNSSGSSSGSIRGQISESRLDHTVQLDIETQRDKRRRAGRGNHDRKQHRQQISRLVGQQE